MAKTLYYNPVTEEMEFVNNPSPLRENLGERFGLNGIKRVALAKGTPGGWWGDWELNYKDQMSFEEYKQSLDIDKNPSGLEKAEGGRIDMKPGGIVEPGVTNYGTKKSPYYTPVENPRAPPPGFITRTALAKLLDIKPKTIMSSKYRVKTGGHGQTLYKNITDILKVKQISSNQPEFYSKPTKIQIDQILAGTGKEGQQAKRPEKSFKIIQEAKIKNPQTNKLWTFEEWKNAPQSRKTYYLGLAKDYEGFRAKQNKWMQITRERAGPIVYKAGSSVFKGDKNGLLRWLQRAAEKKNPNYEVWYKDGIASGVYDKKADTVWRAHTIKTEFSNKKHKSIHKHKDFDKVHGKNGFFEMAKKFKYNTPDTVLGRYFVEYGKIPSYSEIYNFLTRPNAKVTAKGHNALHKHHTSLVKGLPSKNIQLTFWDRNLKAESLLKRFNAINDPNYKNTEWMDKELKKLNVRMKVSNKMLGAAETTLSAQLSKMKETVTKLFKTKLKENPKLVENLMKHLEIVKNAKGPGRVKAINAIIGLVGVSAAGTLFNKFGISSAEAQTLEPGDEKKETSVLPSVVREHPYLSGAAATVAPIAAKKAWEGVKWAGRKLLPIMAPGVSHAFKLWEGKPYDPTSGHDAITMTFWKSVIDTMGKTSKLGDANVPLMKRLKDLAWRGGLPTRFLPLISGAASTVAGPMLIKDAAAWLQNKIDEEGLTGLIEKQSGMIGDEAGASLLMEDVQKEKKRRDVEGMDYAQGGLTGVNRYSQLIK